MGLSKYSLHWYEKAFLAYFLLLMVVFGYAASNVYKYYQTLPLKAKQISTVTNNYFPNTDVRSFTSNQKAKTVSIKGNASILQEPNVYHTAFELCTELAEKKMMPDLLVLNNTRTFNCGEGLLRMERSGNKSDVILWEFNLRDVEEEIIMNQMLQALYNKNEDKAIILAERLVEKHRSGPNLYHLGTMHHYKARNYAHLPISSVHFAQAVEYYKQAIVVDPEFAPAYSLLASQLCEGTLVERKLATEYFNKAKN